MSYENAWFAIGQQKDVNRPFKGRIDDVMVFERDITSEEVVEFYRAQTPDAFSFLPVTGVLRLAKVVSNDVAFTGPTGELAIGITGGEYAVSSDNGATWSEFSSAAPATIARVEFAGKGSRDRLPDVFDHDSGDADSRRRERGLRCDDARRTCVLPTTRSCQRQRS